MVLSADPVSMRPFSEMTATAHTADSWPERVTRQSTELKHRWRTSLGHTHVYTALMFSEMTATAHTSHRVISFIKTASHQLNLDFTTNRSNDLFSWIYMHESAPPPPHPLDFFLQHSTVLSNLIPNMNPTMSTWNYTCVMKKWVVILSYRLSEFQPKWPVSHQTFEHLA